MDVLATLTGGGGSRRGVLQREYIKKEWYRLGGRVGQPARSRGGDRGDGYGDRRGDDVVAEDVAPAMAATPATRSSTPVSSELSDPAFRSSPRCGGTRKPGLSIKCVSWCV